mmetsp:Transcript_2751/g.11216  ORF Transcript_2751/g.11216 Transcript_2751/m.11216 type:complete len:238 (-) Transcript_2751:346-1059(-)
MGAATTLRSRPSRWRSRIRLASWIPRRVGFFEQRSVQPRGVQPPRAPRGRRDPPRAVRARRPHRGAHRTRGVQGRVHVRVLRLRRALGHARRGPHLVRRDGGCREAHHAGDVRGIPVHRRRRRRLRQRHERQENRPGVRRSRVRGDPDGGPGSSQGVRPHRAEMRRQGRSRGEGSSGVRRERRGPGRRHRRVRQVRLEVRDGLAGRGAVEGRRVRGRGRGRALRRRVENQRRVASVL